MAVRREKVSRRVGVESGRTQGGLVAFGLPVPCDGEAVVREAQQGDVGGCVALVYRRADVQDEVWHHRAVDDGVHRQGVADAATLAGAGGRGC